MKGAHQETPETPIMPDVNTRRLRAALILEECLETVAALGFNVVISIDPETVEECYETLSDDGSSLLLDQVELNLEENGPGCLIEIADGVADISVVSIGTLIACGIKDAKLLETVDQNNLDKIGPGHSFRADGKLIKPANHKKPDIASIINEQYDQ
jgi:predicted HAD superfamily Cof-like phosphohydrolase